MIALSLNPLTDFHSSTRRGTGELPYPIVLVQVMGAASSHVDE